MTDSVTREQDGNWTAVMQVTDDPLEWLATIHSLSSACDSVIVVAQGGTADEVRTLCEHHPNVEVASRSVSEVVQMSMDSARALVVVSEPVVVPPDAFDNARSMVEADVRIATVSFFSNDAGYLSVPYRNQPQLLLPPGLSEAGVTELLRSEPSLRGPVPIPVPAGVAVALTSTALRSLGPLLPHAPTVGYAITEFALRAVRRCMKNILDPSAYVLRVAGHRRDPEPLQDQSLRDQLRSTHPFFPEFYDDVMASQDSPLARAISLARLAIQGVSVLIDATDLGPFETGTQVQILNLIQALSRHPKVRKVIVGVAGPVPDYASEFLQGSKIEITTGAGGRFVTQERVDVLHRPCQTDGFTPWEQWREISDRIVVTIQDLIAYNNPSYFADSGSRRRYRSDLWNATRFADGVAVVSEDVAQDLLREKMPVSRENLKVLWNGVDHRITRQNPRIPPALDANGFSASEFIFVLGTSYAHKNRDTAILAWKELRNRGFSTRLVMAGVVVPFGSTRNEETRAQIHIDPALRQDLVVLPDVSADERVWLLTHASLVLYPTSAEGFGLVPFEAAQCGTPTVFTSFGPLAELLGEVPVAARDWSAGGLADAMSEILTDPAIARSQIEAVKMASKNYTWDATADEAVRFYQEILARPAMGRTFA